MSTATAQQPVSLPLLAVNDLVHAYGERQVLAGLSFEVGAGEVVGLLGRNGSGKSTALAIVSGLLPRQGGTVCLDGRELSPLDRRLRARMGVAFQSPSLDQRLSCLENLQLAASLQALPRALARQRVTAMLEMAGLSERSGDLVDTLSGGLRRRLDLGRALIHEPDLLLMDEPTAGLDEAAFRDTWARLDRMRAQYGLSVILTTHRPEEAERCDRIVILKDGKALATHAPGALRKQVSGDLVVLEGDDLDALAKDVAAAFDVTCQHTADGLVIECDEGHHLVPRLVEKLGADRLTSVSLRKPSLADVFLKLTGEALDNSGGSVE